MKSLHTIKNPNILLTSPLNIGSFATSIFDPVLDQEISITPPPTPPTINT